MTVKVRIIGVSGVPIPVIVVAIIYRLNSSVTHVDRPASSFVGLEHLAIPQKRSLMMVQMAGLHLNKG